MVRVTMSDLAESGVDPSLVTYTHIIYALHALSVLIGVTSLLFTDTESGWLSPLLMRIPFLLATALFYGYVVLPERTGQMTPIGRPPAPAARPPVRARVSA